MTLKQFLTGRKMVFTLMLIAYVFILIKVMVFKYVPLVKIGTLMLNLGGVDAGHAPNFIPFKTIIPYLFGFKGWIIAGINLVGNIALLVPLGFIIPYLYQTISCKKTLTLGIISGLVIEVMQAVLHVGIFDIDDVILNAFGFIIGYWIFILLAKTTYRNIFIGMVVAIVAFLFLWLPIRLLPAPTHVESDVPATGDLCGGTGGIGAIVSMGKDTVTMMRKDNVNITVRIIDKTMIKTVAGFGTKADLHIGDRITLVGDMKADNVFDADVILVCSSANLETQSRK